MDTPLFEIARQWQRTSQTSIPILSIVGTVVGTLRLEDVTEAISRGVDLGTTAGQLIDHSASADCVGADEELSAVLSKVGKSVRQLPVTDGDGRLVGLLDLDTMLTRRGLPQSMDAFPDQRSSQFDATT